MIELKSNDKPYPDGTNDFKTLAEISRFPNVFSRNMYLAYALDYLRHDISVHNSCFLNPTPPDSMVSQFKTTPKSNSFHEWAIVFEKFCHFFNRLIFPAEEWYFFLILQKTAEERCSGMTTIEKLLLLQELLADFIVENKKDFINPAFQIQQNNYAPKEDDFTKDTPDIASLLHFFQKANINTILPLPPLDKSFVMPADAIDAKIRYKQLLQYYISIITE